MSKRVVAIVGSYRKGATTDTLVDAILAGARQQGAVTQTIRLACQQVEFCTNCRACTQATGEARGQCVHEDDMGAILQALEAADAVVLASPVNCYNVTAIFRRFMERLLGYTYWPWNSKAPKLRCKEKPRKAVLVATAAMPGFLIPLATGASRALKTTAEMVGARVVGKLWVGLVAATPDAQLSARVMARARRLGQLLG